MAKAESATILSLNQMIDMALGNPNPGVINFNLLGYLLHIIVDKLKLKDLNVEFRGPESEQINKLYDPEKKSPSLVTTTYNVMDEPKGVEAVEFMESKRVTKMESAPQKPNYDRKDSDDKGAPSPGLSQQSVDAKKPKGSKEQQEPEEKGTKDATPKKERSLEDSGKRGPDKKAQKPKAYPENEDNTPDVEVRSSRSKDETFETVLVVPRQRSGSIETPMFTTAVPKTQLDDMQKEVDRLSAEMSEIKDLPTNTGLISSVRKGSKESTAPLVDMYQILSLTKRVDGAEEGIEKLASIIEDVIRELGAGDEQDNSLASSPRGEALQEELHKIPKAQGKGEQDEETTDEGAKKPKKPEESTTAGTETGEASGAEPSGKKKQKKNKILDKTRGLRKVLSKESTGSQKAIIDSLEKRLEALEKFLGRPTPKKTDEDNGGSIAEARSSTSQTAPSAKSPSIKGEGVKLENVNLEEMPTRDAVSLIVNEVAQLRNTSTANEAALQEQLDDLKRMLQKEGNEDIPTEVRMNHIEHKFNECIDQVNALDQMFNDQLSSTMTQFCDLEKEVAAMREMMHFGGVPGYGARPGEQATTDHTVLDLYDKVMNLEEELRQNADNMQQLLGEKEDRQMHIDSLMEQIEMLKTVKADKEDVEEALADKVDYGLVQRKVSQGEFTTTCEDLGKGVEEALLKLQQQEELWQQALMDIQKEVGGKLDRNDMVPLQQFVTHKITTLQEKLKALSKYKADQEAAGAKLQLLRDVKCMSCDGDVVMRKQVDPSLFPPAYAMPPTKSMAPYLAYELDSLRRQQKTFPNSRNMNHFENALQNPQSNAKDHVCNRYCGGSHTTTTPQQRVTRLGHFLDQWGQEVTPMEESVIKGTDGQLYRGREPANGARGSKNRPTSISSNSAQKSSDLPEKSEDPTSEKTSSRSTVR